MFVLKKNYTYFWPVTVESPKDGGGFEKFSFEVEFKQIPDSRIKKIFVAPEEEMEKINDKNLCKEVISNWKDIKDEKGDDIIFSPSNLDKLLEVPTVAKSLVTSYLESLAGSKAKN